MKLKKLIIVMTCILSVHSAYANVSIKARSNSATDFCGGLTGTWTGGGTIETSFTTCHYKGTAIVAENAAKTTAYSITMDLVRDDGTMCPDRATMELIADCENNILTVDTDNADMSGQVNDTGTAADLNGKLFVNVGGQRIEATVRDVHLDKQ
jgi:hypothetical protein